MHANRLGVEKARRMRLGRDSQTPRMAHGHAPPPRESHSGGPEALELAELKLHAGAPHLQAVGPLLREACVQLPSLRGCYLGHLAHLEPGNYTFRY